MNPGRNEYTVNAQLSDQRTGGLILTNETTGEGVMVYHGSGAGNDETS